MDKAIAKNLKKYLDFNHLQILNERTGDRFVSKQRYQEGSRLYERFPTSVDRTIISRIYIGEFTGVTAGWANAAGSSFLSTSCWPRGFSKKAGPSKTVAVADIGCGPGYLGKVLAANIQTESIYYTGLDLNLNKLVKAAKESGDRGGKKSLLPGLA